MNLLCRSVVALPRFKPVAAEAKVKKMRRSRPKQESLSGLSAAKCRRIAWQPSGWETRTQQRTDLLSRKQTSWCSIGDFPARVRDKRLIAAAGGGSGPGGTSGEHLFCFVYFYIFYLWRTERELTLCMAAVLNSRQSEPGV